MNMKIADCEPQILQKYLPESARQIAAHIGLPATIALVEAYGGTTLKDVCVGGVRERRLAEVIGDKAARQYATAFNRDAVAVPTCQKALRAARNEKMRNEFDRLTRDEKMSSGAAVQRIAREAIPPMTDRSIQRIMSKAEV